MAISIPTYTLAVERRETHLHAVVNPLAEGIGTTPHYFVEIARHSIDHRCSRILIERHLPEPLGIWDTVATVSWFSRHFDECVKIAVAEMKSVPTGQRNLEIHLGRWNFMSVRIFHTSKEAEHWVSH